MKVSELIEILKQYPQHQDVMISCGNCNHGHIWYEGQPIIIDHTNQTYGYIDIQILTNKNLGSTFRLVSSDKKVLEQDCIIPKQERPKEEPSKHIGKGIDTRQIEMLYPWDIVVDDLEAYWIDASVYNIATLDEWKREFIEMHGHLIVTNPNKRYLRCPKGYGSLLDMILSCHNILREE